MADCGPHLARQAEVGSPDLCCASGESVEDTQTCFLGNELPSKGTRESPGPAEAALGVRKSKGPWLQPGREGVEWEERSELTKVLNFSCGSGCDSEWERGLWRVFPTAVTWQVSHEDSSGRCLA